ncbi:regulatory protein RecX [Chloroflexota bacterium]
MGKITALRSSKGQRKRVNISLDDRFAFSLEAEVAIQEGLQVGQEIAASQIEALARSDNFHRCLNAATHYLSYRPRSEFELRGRLRQRGFDGDSVEAVLAKLKEQGLVNDMTFAQFWKDNRESFSPRSQWLTKLELRQKGIAHNIIDQIADTIDDGDSAYRAALSKARNLSPSDYQSFRHRLGDYLKRRGFNYGITNQTIERLWQELGNGSR